MTRLEEFLVLAAVVLGFAIYRLVMPVPDGDREAIDRFLKDREQTFVDLRKLWFAYSFSQGRVGPQPANAYKVLAKSADGSMWRHYLGTFGIDDAGNTALLERSEGVWTRVFQ